MSVSDKLLVISAIFFDVHKLETINDALISTRLPGCQSDQRQREESVSVKCVNQPNRLLLQTRQYRPYLARAPQSMVRLDMLHPPPHPHRHTI